jgi:uncharacterized membrane protein YdbT with pleckstrin-like domain
MSRITCNTRTVRRQRRLRPSRAVTVIILVVRLAVVLFLAGLTAWLVVRTGEGAPVVGGALVVVTIAASKVAIRVTDWPTSPV